MSRELLAHRSVPGDPGEIDSRPAASEEGDQRHAEFQPNIDDLLLTLGGISWDPEDKNDLATIDASHPFAAVYEAIELVRTEIDDLLAERASAEAERARLQERLARSRKMEALGLLAGGVAQDLGAGVFIAKPFTLTKIGLALKKELSKNRDRSNIA